MKFNVIDTKIPLLTTKQNTMRIKMKINNFVVSYNKFNPGHG